MLRTITAVVLAAFAFCAAPAFARSGAPDLAACAGTGSAEAGEIERRKPIAVPAAWSGLVRSDLTHFAIGTLGGDTLCVDTSGMEAISDPELSPDGRFLRFGWYGYEVGGYVIVDRSGAGSHFDTGDKPIPSPGGGLAAVVQYSEAAFGTLEGFGVWAMSTPPMRELARLSFPEGLTDWRMDGWHGDSCVLLSALRFDDVAYGGGNGPNAGRRPYAAIAGTTGWRIAPGGSAACPRP